jgi:glycosyltransferase involved in cell wall biosynthesis
MTRPLRLLLFNLATDADATGQGFTSDWINALAPYCDSIDVLTMRAGRLALADNVRVFSLGKEKGYSEIRRGIAFYRILGRLLRDNRYDACFAHMQPLFAILSAPLLLPRRIPITLWYTHKAVTLRLRLAEKLVQHIVTASPESFRLPSRKVRVVGHGIDTGCFVPAQSSPAKFTVLSVSRLRPAKSLETMIAAAALLHHEGFDFRLRIVGEAYAEDRSYAESLKAQVERLGLNSVVEFAGAVPHHAIVSEYQHASLMLNLSQTGSVDKALLEAMACAMPVLTSNEAFQPILSPWPDLLLPPEADAAQVAERIQRLAALPDQERRSLGQQLRQLVQRDHSLEGLAGKLAALFSQDREQTS